MNSTVLKKYIQNGVRTVTDEDDEVDEKKDVSPVVHQVSYNSNWGNGYQLNQLINYTVDMPSLGVGSKTRSPRSILE